MGEILSLVAGEGLTRAIDWAVVGVTKLKQRAEIEKEINEAQIRSAMIPTGARLVAKFSDPNLLEELIANLVLKRKTREESIFTFLGDGDSAAIDFVKEFCEKIDRIMSPSEDSVADVKALRIAEENQSTIRMIAEQLVDDRNDQAAQLLLLEELLTLVGAEKADYERLELLLRSVGDSAVSRYLKAYVSLCRGEEPDSSQLSCVEGRDVAVLALASVAVSAGQTLWAEETLRFCSFDASPIGSVLQDLNDMSKLMGGRRIKLSEDAPGHVEGFINLINFEVLFCSGAYLAAVMYAEDASISWNPIAIEKRYISKLFSDVVMNDINLKLKAQQEIARFKPWFPEHLIEKFKNSLSASFMRLGAPQVKGLISGLSDILPDFAEDEMKQLELRECNSLEIAHSIMVWAEARRNPFLMIDAACKLAELNVESRSELIGVFDRCERWVFPNIGIFRRYVYEIDPNIKYEKFCRLGRSMRGSITFHLIAYDLFCEVMPQEAQSHMETAVSIMEDSSGSVDFLSSSIWVPYLYANGRIDEIKQIVGDFLPIAPYAHVLSFFNALAGCSGLEDVVDDLMESMARASLWDPKVVELVAGHLEAHGRLDIAGPFANTHFKTRPSLLLAEIAIKWACETCIDPNEEVLAFLRKVDSSQSNLTLAQYYREKGDNPMSDALAIRASFGKGAAANRALVYYAISHVSESGRGDIANRVSGDCFVVLSTRDGSRKTLLFFDNPLAVAAEGTSNLAGIALGLQSKEFLRLRGLQVGETCILDGDEYTVIEIGAVCSALCQAGFSELAKSSAATISFNSIDELSDYLEKASKESASRLDVYRNGVELGSGAVYFGIETGSSFVGTARRLGFVGEALCNPELPYRKNPISRNTPIDENDSFLISYNSAVLLSFLDLPDGVVNGIMQKCFISGSTAKRLEKDIRDLLEESYKNTGRLGFDGQAPVFLENNDDTRKYLKGKWLPLLDFISALQKVEPVVALDEAGTLRLLFESESIDMQTAGTRNLIFVTEDILEAQICDTLGTVRRCGVAAMMISMGYPGYVYSSYVKKMVEWGAEPPLENDLLSLYEQAIVNALNRLGFIQDEEDELVENESDGSSFGD